MKRLLIAAVAGAALLSTTATGAHALTILTFGQVGSGDTITGTANAAGTSTTIVSTNAPITVTQIDNTVAVPLTAYFDLSLTSTAAALNVGGSILQDFSGTFSITSGSGGTGINYLSGALVDVAFGANTAFTLSASTPPSGNVTFTSDVITDLALDRGASLSFVDVNPLLGMDNTTIGSFGATVSGDFSAHPSTVPEPATLALLGTGLAGLGLLRKRRA